jgi:hypothetical protein
LKWIRIIWIVYSSFLVCGLAKGQETYTSLNNYNRILINPSYAGFQYESHLSSSYSLFFKSKDSIFNEYTLVYDRYSPKLKGGTAFFFKQGLQSRTHVNTLEFGFSYAPRMKRFQGTFFPSLYLGFTQPVKQWFVYAWDEWRKNIPEDQYDVLPGRPYFRNSVYKLGGGMLLLKKQLQVGISGYYGLTKTTDLDSAETVKIVKDTNVVSSLFPYKILLHFSTRINSSGNGVLIRSKEISPQLILQYENGLFQVKSELRVAGQSYLYSVFMLNNISSDLHIVGGSAGYKNDDFRLVLSGGMGSTTRLHSLAFSGSLSLILTLSTENIKRTFPYKPLHNLNKADLE